MQSNIAARRRYATQRKPKPPPHVTLKTLRLALDMRLEEVAARVKDITGDAPSKGTLSAIESGSRGLSAELLVALEQAYGLEPGSIVTTYKPRVSPRVPDEDTAA